MVAIRFPGGIPDKCPVCQSAIEVEPSSAGDALCTSCGVLVWPPPTPNAPDGYKKPATTVLGPYKLLRRLRRSNFGHVFLAKDPHERLVKINALGRASLEKQGLVKRLTQEATRLAKLEHPHIVDVHSVNFDRGVFFIVKQYIEGSTIRIWLDKLGKLSPNDAFLVIREVATGLAYLHDQGIVHRDLRPDNVWASVSGHVTVDGIGLAYRFDEDQPLTGLGCCPYLSPEQARSAKCVERTTDIYSLGTIAYHLLTGSVPFHADNVLELVLNQEKGEYTPVTFVEPSLPPVAHSIINRMIQTAPEERFQSADDVVAAINASQLAGEQLSFATD